MHEDVWRRAGLDSTEHEVLAPGASDEHAVARVAEIFADELRGHAILTNNSRWISFQTVSNERWFDGNVVLLGVVGQWRKLPFRDPGLPHDVLAPNWSAPAAVALFEKLVAELENPALAHASAHWSSH